MIYTYAGDAEAGAQLKISLCYPSADPDTNRDPAQRFVMSPDGTLRFYNNDASADAVALCVTNHMFDQYSSTSGSSGSSNGDPDNGTQRADRRLTLEACDHSVHQSLAYHGSAPGEKGGGFLEFGDVENLIGLVIL